MSLFYSILISLYFIVGIIVILTVFNKKLKEAEGRPDYSSSQATSALLFLVVLWPLAWKIAKNME